MIALVALAAWYFTGRALRPVEAIRLEAEEITGTTIHRRVPEPDTDDEVGRLARTMNAMLDRLETSSQKQRQFVSDASHELRSPLASIRTNLEVALRNVDRHRLARGREPRARRGRPHGRHGERAARARPPRRGRRVRSRSSRSPTSTSTSWCSTTRCSSGGCRSTPPGSPPGACTAAASSSTRVVRNLVDNAARHANAQVAVGLTTDGTEVELTVDDDGPGIPVDDRQRVFDRFTRLDDGRARDAGGLGLGLSMVKTIAEQHGGTVTIDDAPLGGARVRVRLPAA